MENPYNCDMANCSMSFDSEDEFIAHKKKHELSLSLTPSSFKNPFILDQTPTPTQFLNPVSLELDDLQNDNPFDATFRRANSSNRPSSSLIIPETSNFVANLPDSDVLNTPSVVLPSEPATPISLKPNFTKKLIIRSSDNHCNNNSNTLSFISNQRTVQSESPQQSIADADLPSESANFSGIESSTLASAIEDKAKKVLQTSVITSVGNTAILKSSAVGVPTAVVVARAPVTTVPAIPVSQVGVPVVDQLSDQTKSQKTVPTITQAIPVGTVLLSFNLSEPQAILQIGNNNLQTTVAAIAPQITSTTSNTKQKLKEVLTQNQKSGRKSTSKPKLKPAVPMQLDNSDGAILSSSPPSSPSYPPLKPGHIGRKRRDTTDNVDEKRKRSLERNRAAATRCREKRKLWITNLEQKAVELSQTNVQLQNEVSLLRNEVAQLKTLLLEHKDCPVTLQKKVHEEERETYTTVHIFTPGSEDMQCVPNGSTISPSSSEFMEIEIGSVQSSCDSTSDTSETSYRER